MESESIPPKQRPPELMRGMIQRVSNEIAHFRAAHGDEPDVQNILSTAQNFVDSARRFNGAKDVEAADQQLEQARLLIRDAKHDIAQLEKLHRRIDDILQGNP